ncbi:lipoate--protein ligase family protein [Halococcus agarilyticus]|uniref:lipoate--protein ligase family protein n=1 Tax=Halococcus agarilyticus TaxID=1232219 RepID=UPI000677725D|nr:lipoate--protein ligase family protein [Halococcus agarilyticus]
MRVFEERAADIDADRERTRELFAHTAATGEPTVRAWTPHRQIAFGRRDTRADGYDRAREAAEAHEFPPVEREVGGRAVAYTGSTVAFARTEPAEGRNIQQRYARATADLQGAFDRLGVEAREGEPPESFCPGSHSLQADGKIAGLAQRVTGDAALVAGIVVTRDAAAMARVLEPIYDALDVAFDPDSIGSVSRADGDADPETVARTIEQALVAGYRDGDDGSAADATDDRDA